jgi:hypothetical protein
VWCVVVTTVVLASGCAFHRGGVGDRDASPQDGSTDVAPPPDGSAPDAVLVQQGVAYAATSDAPLSLTLSVAPGVGHVLVMIGAAEHGPLTSITGGGVAAWMRATSSTTNMNIEIWYGTTDGSSATVMSHFPQSHLPMWMHIAEWANLSTAATVDQTSSGAGATSPASAGAVATMHGHDLLVFGVSDQAPNVFGTPVPGAWTPLASISETDVVQSAWYRVVAATATYAPSVGETAGSWDAALAAFAIAP